MEFTKEGAFENNQKRQAALQQSNTVVKQIYKDGKTGVFLRSVMQKYGIDNVQYISFGQTVGDTVLGFYPTSSLINLLQKNVGLSQETSKAVASELIEWLTPILSQEAKVFIPQEKAGMAPQPKPHQTEATPSQKQPPAVAAALNTQPAQASQTAVTPTPASVEPLRTMEKDMDRIHGYGAYRKLYPDVADTKPVTTPEQASQPTNQNAAQTPQAGYQALQSQVDGTIQSLSQDEMLKGKLADTPSYTDPNTPQ